MPRFFRRHGRDPEPSQMGGEAESREPPEQPPLTFEPPRRGAGLPAGRARPDAERATAAEVVRLGEELRREIEAELAATRRQRVEVEAELAASRRRRAEVEAELAATRREPEQTVPRLAAVESPSAHVRRG
jgi:hypothetical protein